MSGGVYSIAPEDRAFVMRQRRLRMRWDQIAGQLGVSVHRVRSVCDPSYDPTVLVPAQGFAAQATAGGDPGPDALDPEPWLDAAQVAAEARGRTVCNQTVLATIGHLARRGEARMGEIQAESRYSPDSISRALSRLKRDGLVDYRIAGSARIWRLIPPPRRKAA